MRRLIWWSAGVLAIYLQVAVIPVARADLPSAPGEINGLHRDANGNLVTSPPPEVSKPASVPVVPPSPSPPKSAPPAVKPIREAVIATAPERQKLVCAAQAITCLKITSTTDRAQQEVPITFGQPFAPGDLAQPIALTARDAAGHTLPLQIDQPASHPDGSASFAVLSTVLPDLQARGSSVVNLFKGPAAAASPAVSAPDGYDLRIEAELRTPQITQITFGNRADGPATVPFEKGAVVTIQLGDAAEDQYRVEITGEMAGGDFPTLTKLAERFMAAINKGKNFKAYKLGEGGGFENLWVVLKEQPERAFAVTHQQPGKTHISVKQLQAWKPISLYTASLRPSGSAATPPEKWLHGPVAEEVIISSPLIEKATGRPHPQLTARFYARAYQGGKQVRTDVVLENDWAYEPSPGNLTYGLKIIQNGKEIYAVPEVTHYHHARWHKTVWSDEAPAVAIERDVPYLFQSRLIANYDLSIKLADTALGEMARRLAEADTKPMGAAFITPYMPTTGGREDIGLLPRWTVLFLLSQDPRAFAAMLANGDAAGSVPIHYRDRPSDQPVSLDDHPGMTMLFGKPAPADAFPEATNGDTPWTPDSAHAPSLDYVPYLMTGDYFYLEEMMFWANWNMANIDPGYRAKAHGFLQANQLRAQAWALRSLGDAARLVPDHHKMKTYFTSRLQQNLEWYVDHYPRNPDPETSARLGWLDKPDQRGSTPPWQIDMLALVVGQLAEDGNARAAEFFRWLARFTVGRWAAQDQGYCRTMAPAYFIAVRTKDGHAIDDWRKLFVENWPAIKECPTQFVDGSFPESPAGYVAYSRAMLAMAAGLGIDHAAEAYQRLRSDLPAMNAVMASDPTWALAPREAKR
jgi:hypothetical protein